MSTSQLDPQTKKNLRQVLRALNEAPHTLAPLGSTSQARELFRALMDGCPERGAEFIRLTGSDQVAEAELGICAGHEAIYEHPEALSALFDLAKPSISKLDKLVDIAIRKLSMNNLTREQVDACVQVIKEHGGLKGNWAARALVNHMSDDQLMGLDSDWFERATQAWIQVACSLVEHGAQLEAPDLYPGALVRASIFMQMTGSTNEGNSLPINVLILAGADWQAALNDPRLCDEARARIEEHPIVRRHRFGEIAEGQAVQRGVGRASFRM